MSVSKPPGTYSSYKPTTTVYEAVPIELRGKRRLITGKDSIHRQMTLTVENTFGVGLCCSGTKKGYYKVYKGNPQKMNLLARGGEFKYYDTVLLILDEDGILHDSNTYYADLEQSSPGAVDTKLDSQSDEDMIDFPLTQENDEAVGSSSENDSEAAKEKEIGVDMGSSEPSQSETQQQNDNEDLGKQSNLSTDATSLNVLTEGATVASVDDNNHEIMQPDEDLFPPQQEQEGLLQTETPTDSKTDTEEILNKGFEFDYTTTNSQTERKSADTKQSSSLKPIIIGSIFIFIIIGVAAIFIANRRKTSHDNMMYYEDNDGNSIYSDNFADNFISTRETSYRIRPIRRGSSRFTVNQSDEEFSPSHVGFSDEQNSPEDDGQSVISSSKSIQSAGSNHSARDKGSQAAYRRSSSNTSENGSCARRSSAENLCPRHDTKPNYHRSRSNGSTTSSPTPENISTKQNYRRVRSNGSTSSNPIPEKHDIGPDFYRSRSNGSATSNPTDSNTYDQLDQAENSTYITDIYSYNNNNSNADDASEGIETMVQMHINDAISLFDDGSNDVEQVNSILQRFDEEITLEDQDGVLT